MCRMTIAFKLASFTAQRWPGIAFRADGRDGSAQMVNRKTIWVLAARHKFTIDLFKVSFLFMAKLLI